jgi:hypothetical protein
MQGGKRVAASKLAAGEMVDVVGQIVPGKTPAYRASAITVLK